MRTLFLAACAFALATPVVHANPYSGTIEKIDPDRRFLTVAIAGKSEIFAVRRDAKLTIDGKPGSIDGLKPDMEIRCSCEPKTRVIAELIAKTPPPPPPPPPEKPKPPPEPEKPPEKPKPPPEPELIPRRFEVGQVGRFKHIIQIRQIIDEKNMLLYSNETLFWLKGVSTEGLVDGKLWYTKDKMHVTGTKRYETASGTSRTVFLVEPFSEPKK